MTVKAQTEPQLCPTCKGKGWETARKTATTSWQIPCPACHGTGRKKKQAAA